MKNLRNSVQLIGNLGNNPEVKTLANGNKVANISIATNESYKNNKGDTVENVQWHNVVAWGKLAEIMEKTLKKGKEVAIEGKLVNRSYDDKEGNTKYITEVLASTLLLLGKKDV